MARKKKKKIVILDHLSRKYMIHICRDGTISYRTKEQPVFNGIALPVFSVDTEEDAKAIQIRFGRKQYIEHPLIPGMSWYKLSSVNGEDLVLREEAVLRVEELEEVTKMFDEFYQARLKHGGPINV